MFEVAIAIVAKSAEWFTQTGLYRWARSEFLFILSNRRVAYSLCVGLTIASATLGWWYWSRARAYEAVIHKTLAAELAPSPQRFKGLESFIMSNLDSSIQDRVRKLHVGRGFANAWNQLADQISRFQYSRAPQKPTLRVPNGSNSNLVFTDDTSPGFLFLSSYILRHSLCGSERIALQFGPATVRAKTISDLLEHEEAIWRDIEFTGAIAPQLQGLMTMPLWMKSTPAERGASLDSRVSQAYVITKNGVTRIVSRERSDPEVHYAEQFDPTTFFPSRPYFWPAFEHEGYSRTSGELALPTDREVGEFFEVSRPYMDLGGNGIVVTLSHGVQIDHYPQSVLCVDLTVSAKASKLNELLAADVAELGEKTNDASCLVPTGGVANCSGASNRGLDETLKSALEKRIEEATKQNRQGEVFGNIQILNAMDVVSGTRPILVSVPISQLTDQRGQVAQFLLFKLDLAQHRRNTILIGLGAATTFGLTTLLLASLWALSMGREQDYKDALGGIEKVLTATEIAYVRLDSQDRIEVATDAFANILGTTPTSLRGQTFESLCADDKSRQTYETVQIERRAGRSVRPYLISIQVTGGKPQRVRIRSEAIPSFGPRQLPVTFGIAVMSD